MVCVAIFDPAKYPTRLNQRAGDDLLLTSSSNYYRGVSQAEAESFYAGMAAADAKDPEPISYGLNSQLTKDETGKLVERTWRVGGMYSAAIERIVYWLEKAESVAQEPQKSNIAALIAYYKSGDLKEFDRYNIGWVRDTVSNVDFVNGFIETYGDPLGFKASWGGERELRGFGGLPPHGGDLVERTVVRGPLARRSAVPQEGGEGRFGQGHHRGDAGRRLLPLDTDRHQPPECRLDPQGVRFEIGDDRQHYLCV